MTDEELKKIAEFCNEDTYENLCYALTPLSVFKKSNKGFEQ